MTLRHRLVLPLVLASACLAGVASAQPHERQSGGYTLRSSTVASTAIDPRTAREHGIEPAADRQVLNVVVLKGAKPAATVPADVHATARSLSGVPQDVPLREAKAANGDLSYVGSYTVLPNEVVDLEVQAVPRGASRRLSLRWRERAVGR